MSASRAHAAGDPPDGAAARAWRARAAASVAADASTGSKRPAALYGPDAPDDAPLHFVRAAGCRVHTVDGRTLVDCTMALGAVALGYADPGVTRAAANAAARGHVAGLSHVSEVTLAERLVAAVPCAERALFLKSGAEAVAAAVRLARAATGRELVIGSGYFGWLDWTSDSPGVPAGVRGDFVPVPFGDVDALEGTVAAHGARLAAIVLEPVVERWPDADWYAAARRLADAAGAVLVFDEIKTGGRLHLAGAQAVTARTGGVLPDLTTYGKAIANGYPLAAVVGRAAVMDAARRSWISSTLAGESIALAAAHAVLDRHAREDVCGALALTGARLRGAVCAALAASGVDGVTVHGLDPMWFVRFADGATATAARRETRFLAAARDAGVLFKRGAYDYAALAHDAAAVAQVGEAAAAGLAAVRALDAGEPSPVGPSAP